VRKVSTKNREGARAIRHLFFHASDDDAFDEVALREEEDDENGYEGDDARRRDERPAGRVALLG
jgi:hypothetical protein